VSEDSRKGNRDRRKKLKSLTIKGVMTGDYFKIVCEKCGEGTKNEYIGWDPAIPSFKATCKRCGTSGMWKLDWGGLPPNPFNIKRAKVIKLHKNWAKMGN
jgi:hypothetical protein